MLTRRLAEFVIDTPVSAIPSRVLDAARDALIDTVGVGIAGSIEVAGEIALAWAQETGAKPVATLWGHHVGSSAAEAAMVNGIAAHALDFDDSMPTLRGHPSTTMVPAAFAVGEATGASGEAMLAAYALGLEVAGKVGRAMGSHHYLRGWHSTATIGAFSSTAVAARLWGLDAAQLATAFGIVASQTAGLVRNFGSMTKPFHAGHAARIAVLSAWLAKRGFTADPAIFDGKNDFFATYGGEDSVPLGDVLGRLGSPWEADEPGVFVKRWPCCYCNHRPLGGLFQLVAEHGIRADEVTAVEVGFLPGSDTALVSENPQTGLQGKFSIEYAMAAALLDGKLELSAFTDAMVQRPAVRALMQKVKRYRIPSDGVFSGLVGYNDLAVVTARGRFEKHIDRVPGSPAWPLSAEDHRQKFLGCAGLVLGSEKAAELHALLQSCRSLPDIRTAARAMVPPPALAKDGVAKPAPAGA